MNSFGRSFRAEIFGESHGPAIGALVDGCPPGIAIAVEDFEPDMARRRSGAAGTTDRREADRPEILSGVCGGRATGAPICLLIRNEDTRSSDYDAFKTLPRPGHADFTARVKYGGFADMRGSGHFSGRVTAGLVAAGVIAKKVLAAAASGRAADGGPSAESGRPESGRPAAISFATRLLEAGGRPDIDAAVAEAKAAGDSVGGLVELRVGGLPAGLGEPFFDAAESIIAHALFAVPAVRGVEFGDGFAAARMRGSEHNDPFADATGRTAKNGAGGVNGGITNGNELVLRVAVKPTSTIAAPQRTADFATGEQTTLAPGGRHDACVALRAAVVLEAALAIALADLFLTARAARPISTPTVSAAPGGAKEES
jgi:chorismate synthase